MVLNDEQLMMVIGWLDGDIRHRVPVEDASLRPPVAVRLPRKRGLPWLRRRAVATLRLPVAPASTQG